MVLFVVTGHGLEGLGREDDMSWRDEAQRDPNFGQSNRRHEWEQPRFCRQDLLKYSAAISRPVRLLKPIPCERRSERRNVKRWKMTHYLQRSQELSGLSVTSRCAAATFPPLYFRAGKKSRIEKQSTPNLRAGENLRDTNMRNHLLHFDRARNEKKYLERREGFRMVREWNWIISSSWLRSVCILSSE